MNQISPARSALNELSVNTHGLPQALLSPVVKTNTALKRHIHDLESPQAPPAAIRHCTAKDTAMVNNTKLKDTLMANEQKSSQMTSIPPDQQAVDTEMQDAEEGSSQASRKNSLSTLDPMDGMTNSQQTAATEVSQPTPPSTTTRAENLRLRLRVAMFKIRTGQTHIPLSQLRITPHSPLPANTSTTSPSSPPQTDAIPTLLPAPVLQPTAFSARVIPQQQLPSSPPPSRTTTPHQNALDNNGCFRTPALPKEKAVRDDGDLQMSSPPDSQERDGKFGEGVTSSAVRGSAARSLLGLSQVGR